MYFPYLRGKQFELLALRDFATGNQGKEKVVPIIEPVKQQFGGLNTAISTMLDSGLQFAMILNPKDGDFKHPNVNNDILGSLTSLAGTHDGWIPAYIYRRNAAIHGDVKAFNAIRDTLGQKPTEKVETNVSLTSNWETTCKRSKKK